MTLSSRRGFLGQALAAGLIGPALASEIALYGDGTHDDWQGITNALANQRTVNLGPRTYRVTKQLVVPEGAALIGVAGKTVIQGARGFNIVVPRSNSRVTGVIIDGDFVNDDKTGASGIVLVSATGVRLDHVLVRNISFQGIALIASSNNTITDCAAENCGHRGINISAGSSNNEVTGFHAENCWRAGVLLGYRSNHNTVRNFYVSGFRQSVGGAGLWVHMNSDNNTFSNFTIGPEKAEDASCPSILLGAGCVGNVFEHGIVTGARNRGIYVWNENVDHVKDLHTSNAAVENNRFTDITVQGTGTPRSYGIGFKSDNGQSIGPNEFDNIRISGFAIGVDDVDLHATGLRFHDIRFDKITAEKMHLFDSSR